MELADAIEQWGLGHRTQLDDADIRLLREVWSTVRRSPLGEIEIDELSAADSKRVMALFGRERRRAVAEVLNVITAWAQTDGDTPVRRRPRPKPSAARPAPAAEVEPEAARPERSRRGRRGKTADKAEPARPDERGHPETHTSRRPREFAAAGEDPERAPDAVPDELTAEADALDGGAPGDDVADMADVADAADAAEAAEAAAPDDDEVTEVGTPDVELDDSSTEVDESDDEPSDDVDAPAEPAAVDESDGEAGDAKGTGTDDGAHGDGTLFELAADGDGSADDGVSAPDPAADLVDPDRIAAEIASALAEADDGGSGKSGDDDSDHVATPDTTDAEAATEPDDEGDASPGDNGDDPSDEDAADEDPSDRAADDASVDLGDEESAESAQDDSADSTEDDSAEGDTSAEDTADESGEDAADESGEDAADESGEDPFDEAESDDANSDEGEGEASESTDEGFDVDDWERELTAAAEADAEPGSTDIDSTDIDLGAAEAGSPAAAAALDEPLPPVELGAGTVDEPGTLIDHIDPVAVAEDTPVLNRGWTVVFSIVGLLTVIALFVLVYFLFLT